MSRGPTDRHSVLLGCPNQPRPVREAVAALVGAQRAAPKTATHYSLSKSAAKGFGALCIALRVCRLAGRWAQHAAPLRGRQPLLAQAVVNLDSRIARRGSALRLRSGGMGNQRLRLSKKAFVWLIWTAQRHAVPLRSRSHAFTQNLTGAALLRVAVRPW